MFSGNFTDLLWKWTCGWVRAPKNIKSDFICKVGRVFRCSYSWKQFYMFFIINCSTLRRTETLEGYYERWNTNIFTFIFQLPLFFHKYSRRKLWRHQLSETFLAMLFLLHSHYMPLVISITETKAKFRGRVCKSLRKHPIHHIRSNFIFPEIAR